LSARNRVVQKPIDLERVGMWCARLGVEAGEAALVALAAGDFFTYRAERKNMQDWRQALHVVNRLVVGRKGESADEQRT
jgi:hypothetical protein